MAPKIIGSRITTIQLVYVMYLESHKRILGADPGGSKTTYGKLTLYFNLYIQQPC